MQNSISNKNFIFFVWENEDIHSLIFKKINYFILEKIFGHYFGKSSLSQTKQLHSTRLESYPQRKNLASF